MAILRELRDAGKTIVMIYHDLDSAKNYFDEVILINKTVVAYGQTSNVLTEEHLKQAYMRGGEVR